MTHRQAFGAALAAMMAVWTTQSLAAIVAWPTYVMSGPGYQYQAIDETERGDTIAVLGCENGWCAIDIGRRRGYVPLATLADAGSPLDWPPQAQVPEPACFLGEEPIISGKRAERFCPHGSPVK